MNFFKKIFQKKEKEPTTYFHEDYFCQVEILPIENRNDLIEENKEIESFSEEHREDIGYSDIYVRDGNKFETRTRKIEVSEFSNLMTSNGYNLIEKVLTGYNK